MSCESDSSYITPICDWLIDANIFNSKFDKIPISLLMDRVDAIVLYFSMRNTDRFNIIQEFGKIYKNTKHINLPVEVINIPMDDDRLDMWKSFEDQPNWLTLNYGDPLIPILQYRYGITSVPHLLVLHTDGTIISSHGILDLDMYGMNALIAWISASVSQSPHRLTKDLSLFDVSIETAKKYEYQRKFSEAPKTKIIQPDI